MRGWLAGSALAAAALLGGCGSSSYDATLQVVGPEAGCLGVVGFEITVAGSKTTTVTSMRRAPVLSTDPHQCRIEDARRFSDLDPNEALAISVVGYDSAHVALVAGSSNDFGRLSAPNAHPLQLEAQRAGAPILVVDRTSVLGAAAGTTSELEVDLKASGPPTPLLRVVVSDDATKSFFSIEPGAFVLAETPPDSAQVTVRSGTTQQKATVNRDDAGYWSVVAAK